MRVNPGILAKSLAATAFFIALHACSGPTSSSPDKKPDPNDSTDVGKPKQGLTGLLFDASGSPLKGATVKAIPDTLGALAKSVSGSAAGFDSAVTDSSGRFVLIGLAKGGYNLQCLSADGKLAFLITGVLFNGGDALLELKSDTLRAQGSITGMVSFGEGDTGKILVTIPGTTWSAVTGDSGAFTLKGIPAGKYVIIYRKEGAKALKDTGITVKTGTEAKVIARELAADPAYPPPAPTGLEIAYDTLAGKATLRWRKTKVEDIAGYLLYRDATASATPTRLGSVLLKDTVFVDAIFTSAADTVDKEFTYRVKSQDAGGTASAAFSKPVTLKAPAPSRVRTRFTWKLEGTKGDSASINDSVTLTADWANPSRKIVKLTFYAGDKKAPIGTSTAVSMSGSSSIKYASATAGTRNVSIEALDDAESAWWDSIPVRFITDAPITEAGKDTSIAIHGKVLFAASATQAFGTIVLYKWDFDGDGKYDDSSAAGKGSFTFDHSGTFSAKVIARDDDGNESFDTRTIEVTNQSPKVKTVRADTTISVNDPVVFTGTGSDTDGTLSQYGWDWDANGTLDTVSATPFAPVYRYTKVGIFNPVFRVTDDDNQIAERSVKITVVKDNPVANAGLDTTVSIKDIVRLKGKGTDTYGTIAVWAWDLGATGAYVIVSKGDTNVTAPATATGSWPCVLRVTDDDGNTAFDTVKIVVLKDAPSANAGSDTTVSIGDAINLRGKGSDLYGTIAERAWDAGVTGTFRVAGTGDTTVFAPTSPGTYLCALRVTDDDGNIAKDTLSVTVVQDAPVANAGQDTTVGVGFSVTLTGSATQAYGTIAMYKWDWQANGSWDDSSATGKTTTFTVSQGGARTVLFGVRDDDGNFTVDTLLMSAVSYVSGTISTYTIYSKPLSPYVLTSDLTVASGGTLVISAGVKISGASTILVQGGILTAVGIAADSVYISCPVRFEGTDLSGSEIGYARMSAAVAVQIGNNTLGSGVTQNSGTLKVGHSAFGKKKIVAEGFAAASALRLDTCRLDSTTVTGDGTGISLYLKTSNFYDAAITALNLGGWMDSLTTERTVFKLGTATTFTITSSTFTTSAFKAASGVTPQGLMSLTNTNLSNTSIDLGNSRVNFTGNVIAFPSETPLMKIGRGAFMKSKFTGAGTGSGLEITGYEGGTITGATTIDSCEFNNYNIGLQVRGFASLAVTGVNFVNSISFDLENLTASPFNALDCYWSGANSTVNVNTRIRDQTDDGTLGKVTFTPWSPTAYSF